MGENAGDISTFESDYEELIKHVQEFVPGAKIIPVGDFWSSGDRETMKKTVSEKLQISYADLSVIWGDGSYQAGLGTLVDGSDGEQHKIEHDGVAGHPGDKGRQYVAEKIIECIQAE